MKKRKIKHQKFWIFFIFALILGLVLGNVFSNAITGKGILNQIMGTNGEKTGYKNEVSQEYEYSSTQKISVSEAYKQFKDNLPESLRQKMEEIGFGSNNPIYPIGCIDYENMDGDWEIFKDQYGYWRARYLGPFPTKIKPYYVVNISGFGSPVEVWPEELPGDIEYTIDSCARWIYGYPTCGLVESYCSSSSNAKKATVFCTGNCTENSLPGKYGCDPAGFGLIGFVYKGGICNYPWKTDFGTDENPLVS